MKTVATLALKPGMVVGEDVLSYKNELIISKKTTLDPASIAKLSRYSIMCVEIMEEKDFATTHFEKVRVSDGFKNFQNVYEKNMNIYKKMIDELIFENKPLDLPKLYNIYSSIASCAKTGEVLLDYLYNMLPTEDDLTYAHCLNSALISGVFGTWLALSKEDMFAMIYCAFLYDIGKLLVSQDILYKPGKLTDSEFSHIKMHTIIGYHVIKEQKLDPRIIKATLQHHERCNGTGYPKGLSEDDIDIFSRLISIIDAYEAMTSARTYRQTLIPFQVIANFEQTADRYSSAMLKSILSHIATTQLGMTVSLSNGMNAQIILINQNKLSRPLVKCNDTVIDLSKTPEIEIVAIL